MNLSKVLLVKGKEKEAKNKERLIKNRFFSPLVRQEEHQRVTVLVALEFPSIVIVPKLKRISSEVLSDCFCNRGYVNNRAFTFVR